MGSDSGLKGLPGQLVSGDNGYLGSLEAAYTLWKGQQNRLQIVPFLGAGEIRSVRRSLEFEDNAGAGGVVARWLQGQDLESGARVGSLRLKQVIGAFGMTGSEPRDLHQTGVAVLEPWHGPWSAAARLTPYGIATLLSWGFSTSGIAETLNLLLYDASTQLRQLPSGRHTPVRLIGITEADIQRYGWPINDRLLAKALERLDQAGTSAIGLDLYRDGPVQPGHDDFTEAIKQNPKLIGIFSLADGISAPPSLPAKQQSFNDLVVDPDGSLRRDSHVGGQPESHVALPLWLLETSTGESLRGAIESGQWNLAWLHPHAGGYSRLDASGYQQMLPFHRPGSFPHMESQRFARRQDRKRRTEGPYWPQEAQPHHYATPSTPHSPVSTQVSSWLRCQGWKSMRTA